MGLHGKLVAAVEFKANADLFHQLLRQKPQHLVEGSSYLHTCDPIQGEFGRVGTIMFITYTHDGKERKAKEVIEAIDEEKRLLVVRVVEGDLMEEYKSFMISCHVESNGCIDLVTWTLDYEMLNEDVGHPVSLLSYFIDVTKHLETYHVLANSSTSSIISMHL